MRNEAKHFPEDMEVLVAMGKLVTTDQSRVNGYWGAVLWDPRCKGG